MRVAAPTRGMRVLSYPIETVPATAIMLGTANTRGRDNADTYKLTGRRDLTHGAVRAALDVTARFRGVEVVPLSSVVDDLVELGSGPTARTGPRSMSTAPSCPRTSAMTSTR